MFGKTSDEVLKLVHDLVGKAAEIKQLSFSRLLSYWKRRIATTLQRENDLFILNSSAHVLSATNRFDPECEQHVLFATFLRINIQNHTLITSNCFICVFYTISVISIVCGCTKKCQNVN